MRLDKYLKVTRLIKRRTIAKEACDNGRVFVNGKLARASYEVKVGDQILIQLGTHSTLAEVLQINEHVPKETASEQYRLLPIPDQK